MIRKDIQTSIKNKVLLAKRQRQIVMAATRLFMEQGFERTSMRQIAKAAGLTVGGLYRYIGSKDDVLWLTTVFGDFAEVDLLARMREGVQGLRPTDALRQSMDMYFRSVDEFQDLYNFHNHVVAVSSPEFRKTIFARETHKVLYFTELLAEGVRTGDFEVSDARLLAHNIVLAANAWANRRWFLRKNYTLEDYISRETEYILRAIQPRDSVCLAEDTDDVDMSIETTAGDDTCGGQIGVIRKHRCG